jgi:PAS domain S-box-containing protein
MSATGNVLVFLRSSIPDWISIIVANTLIVSSTVILLIAFERFVDKKGIQIQNYILIVIFFLVHSYFTFIRPDLNARSINFSLTYVILGFQIAFLMLKRTPVVMRKITWPVGIVFSAVCMIQIIHFFFICQRESSMINYFSSEPSEAFYMLAWEIIIILLAYSIILMYNKRLIHDINIQEEKFSLAFHEVPFIIMLSKLEDGEVFEVNKSVHFFTGYEPSELTNYKTTDLHIWKQNSDRQKFISDLNSEGKVFENEYIFRKKSGELFTGLISAHTIEINNEQCIISVIADITERKMAENKLLASEVSLRELNLTKDKFFSIIAHDLKSPFNGILGFSELLYKQISNKDYNRIDKYAEIILKSSQRAINLLMNLMDWSRLQTGRLKFSPEYFDATISIRSIIELLNISAEQKSICTKLNLPEKLLVYADKFMLETVLRNLISNAIKFTPKKGKVMISIEDKEKEFLFLIEDSGVGIAKKNLEKLFRIDEDFSLPGTENETGTGLGLILCNDFIQKHKGNIWVESEPGVGTKFYFTIPKGQKLSTLNLNTQNK